VLEPPMNAIIAGLVLIGFLFLSYFAKKVV